MKRYILTGTPGCGKTAILRALELAGYPVVEEAATDIIALRNAHSIFEPIRTPFSSTTSLISKSIARCA